MKVHHHTKRQYLIDKWEKMYEISLKNREFELTIFWKRLLFFVGFLASILVAMSSDNITSKPYLEILLCVAGVIVSVAFWETTNVAKFWSEVWEKKVETLEKLLKYEFNDEVLTSNKLLTPSILHSKNVESTKRKSITKIIQFIAFCSSIFFEAWAAFFLFQSAEIDFHFIQECAIVVLLALCLCSILYLFLSCSSQDR